MAEDFSSIQSKFERSVGNRLDLSDPKSSGAILNHFRDFMNIWQQKKQKYTEDRSQADFNPELDF